MGVTMARRHKRRPVAPPIAVVSGDLGTPELHQHGDWRLIEAPTLGRRVMREPIHARLWRAGRLTAAQYQAGEDYATDVAIASGARDGPSYAATRVDGGATWQPSLEMVNAITRLRRVHARLGLSVSWMLERACSDCVSTAELARVLLRSDGQRQRAKVDEMVIMALRALTGEYK